MGWKVAKKKKRTGPKRETLESISAEVNDYNRVVDTLRKKLDTIESSITTEEKTNKLLQEYNDEKKKELLEINKSNLKASYEIEDLTERI